VIELADLLISFQRHFLLLGSQMQPGPRPAPVALPMSDLRQIITPIRDPPVADRAIGSSYHAGYDQAFFRRPRVRHWAGNRAENPSCSGFKLGYVLEILQKESAS
jgi:hypothetical protein